MKKLLFYANMILGVLGFVSGVFLTMNGETFGFLGIAGGIIIFGLGYYGIRKEKI